MPSQGKALLDFDSVLFEVDDMIGRLDSTDTVSDDLINDYVWGSSIFPTPVVLDYTWVVQRMALRPVPPVNSQTISRTGGASAYATNTASVTEYGVFDPGAVNLDTSLDADITSLAVFNTTYQGSFLQRPPQLVFDLLSRTAAEQWRILSVTEGARIILVNTPASFPAQCVSTFVDGIAHVVGLDQRLVVFTCNPLIGQAAGQVGPWFRTDVSVTGGTDVVPF
jgi:hypothetical protein